MKKLITTVGTSLFDNYRKEKKDIEGYYENIKEVSYEKRDEYASCIERIKKSITNYYSKRLPDDASAEIKSIRKIKRYLKEDVEVYLIATDTIASFIAASIIKEFLEKEDFKVYFNPENDVIRGLQVKDKRNFVNQGLSSLVRRIENITGGYYEGVIFNISGGYKAVIPYLTLMAQINGCEMYYIFEDTEELIEIPPGPITLKNEVFDLFSREFMELETGINNYTKWEESHYEFVKKARACIETDGDIAFLSPIGKILLGNYRNRFCVFFATDEVIEKIKRNETLAKVVVKFLSEDSIRRSKTEFKGTKVKHKVYDDGDNDYRIVYDEKDNQIYIYAVFDYEPDEVKFLNDPKQSNKLEDYRFKLYRIDKQSLKCELLN